MKIEPDGAARGVFPSAFEPDPDGVSVTWLEYFGGSPSDQLTAARQAIGRGLTLRQSHRLAKLRVGDIRAAGVAAGKSLDVLHDPIESPSELKNEGHSLIQGISDGDDDLQNRLANSVLALEEAKIL